MLEQTENQHIHMCSTLLLSLIVTLDSFTGHHGVPFLASFDCVGNQLIVTWTSVFEQLETNTFVLLLLLLLLLICMILPLLLLLRLPHRQTFPSKLEPTHS